MNIRGFVKTRATLILIALLIINILYIMSISLQSMSAWKRKPSAILTAKLNTGYDNLYKNILRDFANTAGPVSSSDPPSFSGQPATTAALNLSRNSLTLKKIDTMHRYLNLSLYAKDNVYPAMRIGRYLMVYPNLCSDVNRVHLVIIVHTAPKNLQRRQRIRETFGNRSLFYPFNVRVAFLLGKTHNTTLEHRLVLEHALYNDTVMGDFIDDYHNLTLKGVMGYRWVSQYCPNSEIVLKIDDDVFINTYKLLYSYMKHMRGKQKSIFCNHWHKNTKPIFRKGKWKVDDRVFPKMSTFPYDYCSGFIVLISSDMMKLMHQASMMTPFFWIDDVFLFGVLPNVVGGVTFYNLGLDINVALDERKAINCTLELGESCTIFGSVISNHNYWPYWEMVYNLYMSRDWKGRIERIE